MIAIQLCVKIEPEHKLEVAKTAEQSDDWMLWILRPRCIKWLNANQSRSSGLPTQVSGTALAFVLEKQQEMRRIIRCCGQWPWSSSIADGRWVGS